MQNNKYLDILKSIALASAALGGVTLVMFLIALADGRAPLFELSLYLAVTLLSLAASLGITWLVVAAIITAIERVFPEDGFEIVDSD